MNGRISRKTLYSKEMTSVIPLTCQWFYVLADRCKLFSHWVHSVIKSGFIIGNVRNAVYFGLICFLSPFAVIIFICRKYEGGSRGRDGGHWWPNGWYTVTDCSKSGECCMLGRSADAGLTANKIFKARHCYHGFGVMSQTQTTGKDKKFVPWVQ